MRTSVIIILLLITFLVHGQEYAGPNKNVCGEQGVTIGIPNPNPEHCYLWDVADGLEASQVNNPNPIVKPKGTTRYTVTVTDQQFSFKALDAVTVVVDFGDIQIEPRFVYANGESDQAQAMVLSNIGNWPVVWDKDLFLAHNGNVVNDHGCTISESTGWISGCTADGRLQIIARREDDETCFATFEAPVNRGVKDIVLTDQNNPERMGHASSSFNSLYVDEMSLVKVQALANDESVLPQGQPDWSGSSLLPSVPHAEIWYTEESLSAGGYVIRSGDPAINLGVFSANEEIQNTLSINTAQFNEFSNAIMGLGPFQASGVCQGTPVFEVFNPSGEIKTKFVEKFEDPDLGKYRSYDIDDQTMFKVDFTSENCTYLLRFGKAINAPETGYVYIAPNINFSLVPQEIKINVNGVIDQSTSNPDFDGTVTMEGGIFYGCAIDIIEELSDGPFFLDGDSEGVTGSYSASLEVIENNVFINYQWDGLQLETNGKVVYNGAPSNPVWTSPSLGSINVLDGKKDRNNLFTILIEN